MWHCNVCSMALYIVVVFRSRISNLNKHMKEQHDPDFKRAKCPHSGCTSSYLRPSDLKIHIRDHH